MRKRIVWFWRLTIALLLMLYVAEVALAPRGARAAGLKVTSFYSVVSRAVPNDYFATWCNISCAPPPRATAYTAGIPTLDFYFATTFPAVNAGDMEPSMNRVTLDIMAGSGARFEHCALSAFSNTVCNDNHARGDNRTHLNVGMIEVWAPQQPQDTLASVFPNDTYRAILRVDGAVAASTTFRIGPAGVHPGPTGKTAISAFYPVSSADSQRFAQHQHFTPARLVAFPSGARYVYFYLRYSGFTTAVPFTIHITAPVQRLPLVSDGPHYMRTAGGSIIFWEAAPEGDGYYPGGTYTASIVVGTTGTVMARTSFSVHY